MNLNTLDIEGATPRILIKGKPCRKMVHFFDDARLEALHGRTKLANDGLIKNHIFDYKFALDQSKPQLQLKIAQKSNDNF